MWPTVTIADFFRFFFAAIVLFIVVVAVLVCFPLLFGVIRITVIGVAVLVDMIADDIVGIGGFFCVMYIVIVSVTSVFDDDVVAVVFARVFFVSLLLLSLLLLLC